VAEWRPGERSWWVRAVNGVQREPGAVRRAMPLGLVTASGFGFSRVHVDFWRGRLGQSWPSGQVDQAGTRRAARPRRPRCRISRFNAFLETGSTTSLASFDRARTSRPLVDISELVLNRSASSGWSGLHARYCAVGLFRSPVRDGEQFGRLVDDDQVGIGMDIS